ncbi:pyrroline-5-carboxylate reductase [Malassezia sp. CBS 17886]|nr:pyrroline-5-carboxylate reductase [Malassezia sp. CBS 17886]
MADGKNTYTLAVLACGTMGTAIVSGMLDSLKESPSSDAPRPDRLILTVNRAASVQRLQQSLPTTQIPVEILVQENTKAVRDADVVLLCCKPQLVRSIMGQDGMQSALVKTTLISIAAGVRLDQLAEYTQEAAAHGTAPRVVRVMSNTPSKIREGMSVIAMREKNEGDRAVLSAMFSAVGRCLFLEEKYFDACTALAGSGPAFAAVFLEAMADGGVMMGLPRAEAMELAAQTLQGTARLALQTGMRPAAIKDSVTTPGGCTIAGLLQLEDGRIRSTVARTIQTATEHAASLGKAKEQ